MLRYVFTFINFCFILLIYPLNHLQRDQNDDVRIYSNSPASTKISLGNTQVGHNIKLHLNTSSYFYNLQEDVYCNLLLLNAEDLRLITFDLGCVLILYDSKMQKIAEEKVQSQMGSVNKVYPASTFKTGGEYTIQAECMVNMQKVSISRKFIVQSVIYDDVLMSITPDKEQYIPGDSLKLGFTVRKPNGQMINYTTMIVEEIIKGEKSREFMVSTDFEGRAELRLKIDGTINENDLLYLLKLKSDGLNAVQTERIYLNIKNIKVSLYFENGFYHSQRTKTIIVLTSNDKGDLTTGKCVVKHRIRGDSFIVQTNQFGLGKFVLKASDTVENYRVYPISQPQSAIQMKPVNEGVVELAVVNKTNHKIRYVIRSNAKRMIQLKIHQRGQLLVDSFVECKKGDQFFEVVIGQLPPGIIQGIVFDSAYNIIAQKLNFVNRQKKLFIHSADNPTFIEPKSNAQINFIVKDEKGNPVEGFFNIAITDEKNFLMVRNKQTRLSESILFESDLEYPVTDIGLLWNSTVTKDDSLLDEFLNCCRMKDIYIHQLFAASRRKVSCYYEFKIEGRSSGYTVAAGEIKRVVFHSGKGTFVGYVRNNNEVLVSVDSIDFPARCTVVSKNGREKFYIDETYVRLVIKDVPITITDISDKNQQLMVVSTNTSLIKDAALLLEDEQNAANSQMSVSSTSSSFLSRSLIRSGYRAFNSLASLSSGVTTTAGGLSGRGSRTDGTVYFIDGVRVLSGNDGISKTHINGTTSSASFLMMPKRMYSDAPYSQPYVETYKIKKYRPNGVSLYDTRTYRYDYSTYQTKPISTYYYHTCVKSDRDGKFGLNITAPNESMVWHIAIEGVSNDSRCGESDLSLNIQNEIYMKINTPRMISDYDTAIISCTVYNSSGIHKQAIVSIDNVARRFMTVPANGEVVIDFPCQGTITQKLTFSLFDSKNNLLQTNKVEIPVFKSNHVAEQYFSIRHMNTFNVDIADNAVQAVCSLTLNKMGNYTSLEAYLKGMMREPHGCFEQVSSTNYPNILAYQYLKKNKTYNSEVNLLEGKKQLLISGYRQLANYETSGGGFSWYGDGAGNEALSAMGLLQFHYMKQCNVNVSEALEDRTIRWLLSKRNKNGVFQQSQGKYGFSNTSQYVAHAYVTYVLNLLDKDVELSASINAIESQLKLSDNFYNEALLFSIYLKNGENEKAKVLYQTIFERAMSLMGESNDKKKIPVVTIVSSSWNGAVNEALAIVSTAISRYQFVEGYILAETISSHFLGQDFYNWGNMQSKAMVVEALSNFNHSVKNYSDGMYGVILSVNGEKLRFTNSIHSTKVLDLSKYLIKGSNTIQVMFDSINVLNGHLNVSYETKIPFGVKPNKALQLTTGFSNTNLKIGNSAVFNVSLANSSKAILPQTIAIIELPSGVTIKPEELLFLKKTGVIDFYEITNNTLVLYFEEMHALQNVDIKLPVICAVKGSFVMKASCIYTYYQPETKTYCLPQSITIR
ncbi:MAG: alpha-2-macroglobulin family protein [Bacteroidota bacterium]